MGGWKLVQCPVRFFGPSDKWFWNRVSVTPGQDHHQLATMRLQATWWHGVMWFWLRPEFGGSAEATNFNLPGEAETCTAIADQFDLSATQEKPSLGNLRVWLPAEVLSVDAGTGKAQRAEWVQCEVRAAGFTASSAADLLIRGRRGNDPVSPSVAYWSALARYAVELLARQRFMPALEETERGYRARWLPAICDEAEVAWLERVVATMPPGCRVMVTDESHGVEPVWLVESFLEATIDGLSRRFLHRDEFFSELPCRARREKHWELVFLSALVSSDDVVKGDSEHWAGIAEHLTAWTAPLLDSVEAAPHRVGFELVEPAASLDPATDGDSPSGWGLRVLVKSSETGELLDPAGFWRPALSGRTALRGRAARRWEELRLRLKEAAAHFAPIRRAVNMPKPEIILLSTREAHQFLREAVSALSAADFEVLLPEWAMGADRAIGLYLDLSAPGISGEASPGGVSTAAGGPALGLGALVDFNWRIAVGEERLSADEFEKLVTQNAPLVRFRNQWIGVNADEARRALEFVRKQQGGRMSLAQALRLAGGAEDNDLNLPVMGLSGSDWLGRLLAETPEQQLAPLPQPRGFKGELRPYQLRGLAWLDFLDRLGIGSCLADDMGLGKTIQLIALLLHERERVASRSNGGAASGEEAIGPTLLFAPMSVVGNWEREIARFAPSLRVLVHHGALRLGGDAFVERAMQSDVVITTYGLAGRELEDFSRVLWHRVAMDEAQKIKNPSAAQTIALRSIGAPHRVALTGTPLENHLSELWSIMDALNPGLLGTLARFRTRYVTPIERNGDATRAEQLRRFIRPFVLRRLKNDPTVSCDLPEKMEMRVYCNLTPEQAALYEQAVASMLEQVDRATGIRRRGLILSTLTRLKQICNHPLQFLKTTGKLDGRSGKCERLMEMMEEVLEEGDAALVFTQFREMGVILEQMLAQRLNTEVLFLHGGTPMKKRNELIDRFQNEKDSARIFLLSLRAGGFGLNLTRANHVFHFDRWWNPAVEGQATDRAHRIGQTRRVQVHKFVCIGTVEERIDRLLTEKSALAENIVGSGDDWLTSLSTVELSEYLTLSNDAVAEVD